jgi:hypothetical protein
LIAFCGAQIDTTVQRQPPRQGLRPDSARGKTTAKD